jgi:hypothetical protein
MRDAKQMEIKIVALVEGQPDELELRALHGWLIEENPRPGRVTLVAPLSQPGTMGALGETLQVALGTGGAATVLAGSVTAWLATRHQKVAMLLKRPDGEELRIDAQVKDPEATIQRFLMLAKRDD